MAQKIKLENIVSRGFDRQTGTLTEAVTLEYVCENCRHLIEVEDKFCWQCGTALEQSNLVEHYSQGQQLSDEEFNERKGG